MGWSVMGLTAGLIRDVDFSIGAGCNLHFFWQIKFHSDGVTLIISAWKDP
jgi:hypothetical protein